MATAIYSEPERPDDARNPVRFVTSAGMPPAIWEAFERRFDVRVLEWYGAVEGGLAVKPVGQGPVGSFGKPMAGLEMKVLDERDVECAPGVVGELCSRPASGDRPRVEYFGNPEASEAKTRGGWLRSGDMGHRDAEGWLFFDYRKGGGIRHNGDFVNAGFVEKVIAEHPDVSDVFVYGVPAASGAPGEKDVVAAIVAAPGRRIDPASVFARCRAGLEANFVPSYLQVVPEIPKTASEKPQERFLLDRFAPDAKNVHAER
jgi:crotonobetaine/carnitine-CoA ligase